MFYGRVSLARQLRMRRASFVASGDCFPRYITETSARTGAGNGIVGHGKNQPDLAVLSHFHLAGLALGLWDLWLRVRGTPPPPPP